MKAFYTSLLIVLGLFVLLGLGVFVKGALEHQNRPLVSVDTPGVQSALTATAMRAAVENVHAFV